MARTFTARDFITLPTLTAEEAAALATELVTAATSAGKLPVGVAESLDDLREAKDAHAAQLQKRSQAEARDPRAAREADITLDRAWSATESWLSGWSSLEAHDNVDTAKALHARLFPEGLSFLTKSFKAEWAESEARLGAIDTDKLAKSFDVLGGKASLQGYSRASSVSNA